MMRVRTMAAIAATVLLLGCERQARNEPPPPPREITSAATGHFCGMSLREHPGPKGQIFVEGQADPVWFVSVRETFAYTMLPEEPKTIAAIYVSDMGKARDWDHPGPGNWVDAHRAYYVIGSARRGGMDVAEAVPFGTEAGAQDFARRNGGQVVTFGQMPRSYILAEGDGNEGAAATDTGESP